MIFQPPHEKAPTLSSQARKGCMSPTAQQDSPAASRFMAEVSPHKPCPADGGAPGFRSGASGHLRQQRGQLSSSEEQDDHGGTVVFSLQDWAEQRWHSEQYRSYVRRIQEPLAEAPSVVPKSAMQVRRQLVSAQDIKSEGRPRLSGA